MQNSASNQATNSSTTMTTLGLVAAMVYVVVLSNVLVQYPLNAEIGAYEAPTGKYYARGRNFIRRNRYG